MKKKTAPKKTTAKKTVKQTAPRSSRSASPGNQTLLFRRIVIISACLVLFFGVMATVDRPAVRGAVEGASIMAGLDNQATVSLPTIAGAKSFNIYYGQEGQFPFTNAVRNISPNVGTYTISDLKKGVTYQYYYVYVNAQGKEVVPPQEVSNGHLVPQTLSDIQPM